MLTLFDSKKSIITQWNVETPIKSIDFIIHNQDILSTHSDENSITLFYGFLDQNYTENNAALFISKLIRQDGISGLNKCYGSFILLHLDINSKTIVVANDAMGDFAVHYYKNNETLHISDLPEVLLNKQNKSVNETRLLHYFALTKPQNNACFYSDISQLNPGCYLTLDKGQLQQVKYYKASEKLYSKPTSLTDLSKKFLSLMQTVINFQTHGQSNIGVMMSGGMDSTFVAANSLKINKNVSAFSYVFPNYPQADESRWLDAMRNCGFHMNTFSGEPYWPLKPPFHTSLNAPMSNPYQPMKEVIYQQAHNKNIKYLLSGIYADHLYAGYIYWLVDQLKHNPIRGIKSLFEVTKQKGLINALRQIAPAKWNNKSKLHAPWLAQDALKKHQNNFQKTYGNNHPHPQQFALTYGSGTAQSVWLDNECSLKHKLFVRHPFRDRRIVEFLMELPAWILGNINQPKDFVRNTANNLLPDAITKRQTITTLIPVFINGVLKKEINKVKELLSQSNNTWQNYVDEKLINNILKSPNAKHTETHLVILWQCISYEMWRNKLRQL